MLVTITLDGNLPYATWHGTIRFTKKKCTQHSTCSVKHQVKINLPYLRTYIHAFTRTHTCIQTRTYLHTHIHPRSSFPSSIRTCRSYDIAPPPCEKSSPHFPANDPKYAHLSGANEICTESLKVIIYFFYSFIFTYLSKFCSHFFDYLFSFLWESFVFVSWSYSDVSCTVLCCITFRSLVFCFCYLV